MAEHPEFHPDLGGYVLGTLEAHEAEAFEAHLVDCPLCQGEVAELGGLPGLLAGVMAEPAVAAQPPAGLRERTLAAVEMAATAPARAPERGVRPGRPGRPARRWVRLAAVAAAVVLVGVAAGVVRQVSQPSTAVAEIELVAAEAGGPGSGRAEVRQTSDGREVELHVRGLAPAPPGSYYECWFVGEGDSLERPNRVSVGTFTVGSDGEASLRMFSAADASRFPKMGVTLEPDDGNPARTGTKVLVSK